MKKGWIILLAVIVVIAVLGMPIVGSYNGLVSQRETVEGALSTIDVQLKRRNDLIPNLVSTVKGYAAHETQAIEAVSDARAKMAGAQGAQELAEADAQLSGALSRLLVVVENYPELKADVNFRQLSDELAGTENRIAVARQDFNDAARSYNTKIKSFPTNILAGVTGFDDYAYFEASEADRQVPQVNF